jgi:hypothetical protein
LERFRRGGFEPKTFTCGGMLKTEELGMESLARQAPVYLE